jgi:hypothetical protein
VHGRDPTAAPSQKIWGRETTWGSFAQFTKVQAQQLLPKPQVLTWEEAATPTWSCCGCARGDPRLVLRHRVRVHKGQQADRERPEPPRAVAHTRLRGRRVLHCLPHDDHALQAGTNVLI